MWRGQTFCIKCFKRIRKEKEKAPADCDSGNIHTELTPCKCFKCISEDHLIAKFPKPPKENDKWKKQVCFSERGNRESQRESDNGEKNNDQYIYASIACMSDNDKCPSRYFGDSSELTNWILDSGATCHMMPQV